MRHIRGSILASLLFICCLTSTVSRGDPTAAPSADTLVMTATRARLWDQGSTSVAELLGPVHIELNGTKMSADNAVVWIGPNPGGAAESHRITVALIGKGQLQQEGVFRMDRRLLVTATVNGDIKLVGDREAKSDETSALYMDAVALRDGTPSTTEPATNPVTGPFTKTSASQPAPLQPGTIAPLPGLQGRGLPGTTQPVVVPQSPWMTPAPATPPTTHGRTPEPAGHRTFQFDGDFERTVTPDGNIAAVFSNHVDLTYGDEKGNLIEFVAHDMVLFTNLKELRGAGTSEDAKNFIEDHIVSAYFEGDVQVYVTPAGGNQSEIRLRAEQVYYEFSTDRAIMTDVVFHTVDLKKQIPMLMRASTLRQLSSGEYKFENVEFSTSQFAVPTYSIKAAHAYIRAENTEDATQGERVTFSADNATVNAEGIPFFYFPGTSGVMNSKGTAFRTADINNDNQYGFGLRTKWGLFETLNMVPPKDLDATYTLDYLSKRGPGGGIDANYSGGFVSDTTRQPWNFLGDFHSYFVDDRGVDVLGAARLDEKPPDTFRGRVSFEHQHFFPDDWQAQLRLGYVSDSNFMAQWFNDEYQNGLPVDESFYLKHAHDSESYSFLAEAQPNRAISNADEEQQNREVSRLPELTYDRLGDSVIDDHLTFISENSASDLKFVRNTQSLTQQGFYPLVEPGLPSYAYTGDPGSTTFRGDFRQELDYPINAGPFKVVPYVFGRYTAYSQGVNPRGKQPLNLNVPATVDVSGPVNRVLAGGGARITTAFWKVDNSFESDLFDLHRLRHVIEPELNIFASASNVDQNRVFIYDPHVDAINDVEAVQIALRQRWQTKRGGPGRWRNVDVFSLNVYGNFFGNQPSNRFRDPVDFRGLYLYGQPETSVARNSANVDATWRVSDTTTVLSDVEENLDRRKLATASVGVAVQRDERLTYFIGTRYIADLNSNIATIEAVYQLDNKYKIAATESLDLAQNKDVYYTFALIRSFDNLSMSVRVYYDQATNSKGFSFGLQPFGLAGGVGSSQLAPQR